MNGQILDFSIPLFKTHISIEPGFTQPKINLVTISFTIPKILGGKIDYPVMEAIVYKLLQTRYTELNETGTYTKGERWKQTPFTIKAYQDLGFRLDPNGVWIDWYNNRDTQLLSQFQDDKVYLDDGKYYEGVSVFVNPVGYESVESLWML